MSACTDPFRIPPMSKLTTALRRFVRIERGATMAEYALLIAAVALVGLVSAKTLGTKVQKSFTNAANSINVK